MRRSSQFVNLRRMFENYYLLVPVAVALTTILITKRAALSLLSASFVGVLMIHSGNVLSASKALLVDHVFPSISGPWHIGPIIFTLILGSFSQVLERSGGFHRLLQLMMGAGSVSQDEGQRRALFSTYGMGCLCFFDGLANAILVGRVSRPLTDALRVSRQMLAYVIDSTSSAVACIAFISTWVATQLSLIEQGVQGSGLGLSSVDLFFRSIPANPYCWTVLVLLWVVIWRSWWIGPMRKYQLEVELKIDAIEPEEAPLSSVLLPLASLLLSIPGVIYLWQDGEQWSWRNAFSSASVPQAMVVGASISLLVSCASFPKKRRNELTKYVVDGAAALLPALLVLVFAWTLGSVFKELGVAQSLSQLMEGNVAPAWFPLVVFLVGAVTSFLTGSSWGTMGLLMPLSLPVALELGAEMTPDALAAYVPMVIGAVFGGSVFGDNCSPFSDTTIVTALATGCSPSSHVLTQLPYALIAALAASLAYAMMALELSALFATVGTIMLLVFIVVIASKCKKL